ncbi:MAG TPA: hypothetical protein VFS32_10285 [Candidatus Limnocylindrales bacterium]|nr:hypothetical protein [Candidatus Limnocylindrales bacterium]
MGVLRRLAVVVLLIVIVAFFGQPLTTGGSGAVGEPNRASDRSATRAPLALPIPSTAASAPAVAVASGPAVAVASEPAVAAATSIVPGAVHRTSLHLTATYDASLRIRWASGTIRVHETISVRNTSTRSIDRLELNTVAAKLERLRNLAVSVDGSPAAPAIRGQTIVVPLGGVLPVGADTTVRLAFTATLRATTGGSNWLFAKAHGIADLYRWLPWVSRRTPFGRPNFGDPFVTPTSPQVTVRISATRPLRYATSGRLLSNDGGTKTYRATNVRDFAVVASPDFRRTSGSVDGVRVIVFAKPGSPAASLLTWAKRALHAQAAKVGAYPYRTFTVAETAGGYGMEAPASIWIPRGIESWRIPYLVEHETAHQWFYGIVGNDQAREPWTDEAAADFLARRILRERRASRCATARLDRSIYDYSSGCYYEVVYIQGGNLIDDVRQRIGATAFWKALRGYVAANRYGLAHERTLLDALDDATSLDLAAWRFEARFPSRY